MALSAFLAPVSLPPGDPVAAWNALVSGMLAGLALVTILAWRPLRSTLLLFAGLSGLGMAVAWGLHTGLDRLLLGGSSMPLLPRLDVALAGLSLAVWTRVAAELLGSSPRARRLEPLERMLGFSLLAVSLLTLAPAASALAGWALGVMGPLMALLVLLGAGQARREGVAVASPMAVAAAALLGGCGLFWLEAAGRLPGYGGTLLRVLLGTQAFALASATVLRMIELRREMEANRIAEAERQAEYLALRVREAQESLAAKLAELERSHEAERVANLELQRALDQLDRLAATDRLTGAWNRRHFEEAAASEISLARRRKDHVSLMMLDLDHFKRVNDTWGHPAGDRVLVGLAQVVRGHLRVSDALVRWGGEEFIILAPATPLEGAMILAEKIRASLEAEVFPDVGTVTMSLGVAEYAMGETLEGWVGRADLALYAAKAGGRNRAVAAPPPDPASLPNQRSVLELIWEEEYASGIPMVDSQHQRLFGLANQLLAAATERRPLEEISRRFDELQAHTVRHFQDEEALLRKAGYPDLAEHQQAHTDLLQTARALQREVDAGELDLGRLLVFLATDLVKGHLTGEDRNYFRHMHGG